jgi:hypothetical protein
MTALAVAPTLLHQLGGEPTLDDLIVGAREGLTAHSVVMCPVCDGELAPERGANGRVVGGSCRSCGSRLT